MSIRLSYEDKNNILKRVRIVNDYYVTLNQDITTITKLRKKCSQRDMDKYDQVHELLTDYPGYSEYEDHAYGYGNDYADRNAPLNEAFTLPKQYLSDSKKSGLNFHYDYYEKIRDAYHTYQKMLTGTIYGYLYRTYGKSVPKTLLHSLDFSGILENADRVFADLDAWWGNITSQNITDYTREQNRAKLIKSHRAYIQNAKEQIQWLVADNHFKLRGRTLHVSRGDEDLGIKTLLGSDAINALLFYGTYYDKMSLKNDPFYDQDYRAGEKYRPDNPHIDYIDCYKNHGFTIKFANTSLARKIYQDLDRLSSKLLIQS